MADEQAWPMAKFYFSVTFEGKGDVSFQEVDGLESETQIIEYRNGDSGVFAPMKMPGLARVGNVTMRKGIFSGDNKFWEWYDKIILNTAERLTVVISLLDESGEPKTTWTLFNAWPTKITGTDLKSEGNEVAVESIEIAYETLEVSA